MQRKHTLRYTLKIICVCGITLTGLNLLAGTVLLDVMYTNSQLDTRIVSENGVWTMGSSSLTVCMIRIHAGNLEGS